MIIFVNKCWEAFVHQTYQACFVNVYIILPSPVVGAFFRICVKNYVLHDEPQRLIQTRFDVPPCSCIFRFNVNTISRNELSHWSGNGVHDRPEYAPAPVRSAATPFGTERPDGGVSVQPEPTRQMIDGLVRPCCRACTGG